MKITTCFSLLLGVFGAIGFASAQCEADHTILVADYFFSPTALTISPGETVAFINIDGTHDINGVSSSVSGESFGNPEEFALESTVGTVEGTCMGVITLSEPGFYSFDSGVGFDAELGMEGSITVDIFTIYELMTAWLSDETSPQAWQSYWAMQSYCEETLAFPGEYTVFVPSDAAVDEVRELMNLNQFDLLAFSDMAEALNYHIALGTYMASDLEAGMSLSTVQGQELSISNTLAGTLVNDALIVETDYTTDNGVIHIIDKTLAPSGFPLATVFNIVQQSTSHNLFELAIENAFLDEVLRSQPLLRSWG